MFAGGVGSLGRVGWPHRSVVPFSPPSSFVSPGIFRRPVSGRGRYDPFAALRPAVRSHRAKAHLHRHSALLHLVASLCKEVEAFLQTCERASEKIVAEVLAVMRMAC